MKEIKEKFIREVDPTGANLAILNGEKVDIGKLNEAIFSSSLLASKRLIIVEGLLRSKVEGIHEQLLELLKKRSPAEGGNIVVFREEVGAGEELSKARSGLFKFLAKQKFAQEFKPLSSTETANWIRKEAEARGGKISSAAAGELAALVGNDLWHVSNEIDKLVNFKAAQKLQLGETAADFKIEPADVAELVTGIFDERIFALTDALAGRQKPLAAKMLEEQINAGAAPEYVLSMIVRQFRILLSVRQAIDLGEGPRKVATHLKLHPFVAQKAANQARGFGLPVLKGLLDRLLEIDYLNKSGRADVLTSLDLLIAKL